MPRVAPLVTVVGVLVALPLVAAPLPKELKATRPQFRVLIGGPTLDGKERDWGVELLLEWEWVKPDEQGGLKLTKWEASSTFGACDAKTLLAKGTADPKRDVPGGGKAILLASEKEHLLLCTRRKPLGNTWIPNGAFGFSNQDPNQPNASKSENGGYHTFDASLAIVTRTEKAFAFGVPAGDDAAVVPLGLDTTVAVAGTVRAFLATTRDGETHITVHGNLGGVTFNTRPNSVHLERRGKLVQESPKDAPVSFGKGLSGQWRFEYTDHAK